MLLPSSTIYIINVYTLILLAPFIGAKIFVSGKGYIEGKLLGFGEILSYTQFAYQTKFQRTKIWL